MKDGKLPFDAMNEYTYQFNQAYWDGKKYRLRDPQEERNELIKMIVKTTDLNTKQALYSSAFACYQLSFIFNIWFNGYEAESFGLEEFFKYIYENNFFRPSDAYQMQSSDHMIKTMIKDGLLDERVKLRDVDYRSSGETRSSVYSKLIGRMRAKDFHCVRVCFGADAQSDHALIVTNDNNGKPIVLDTSWRPHESPDNEMEKYVTPYTIRWWNEIYL